MPTVTTAVEVTTEVQLAPAIKKRLLTELRSYQAVSDQIKVLEHAKDKHKAVIGKIREDADATSLKVDGFTVTLCSPIRKKWNPKKFVALGGILEYYTMAHDDVTSKAFDKISCPGADDDSD